MRAWVLAILVLSLSLTGCLGGGDETGTVDDSGPAARGDQGGNELEALTPLRFGVDEPVSEVRWENGTFQVAEHSYPKGVVTSQTGEYDPDRREIDVTPLIPQDVPVRLTAEVNADLGEGDLDIWFQLPQEEIWTSDFDTPYGGYSRVEMTVLHTSREPITLMLRYDEIDDSESFDYTLKYSVQAEPATLSPGVPTGIHVPEEATALRVEFGDEREDRSVLVWDPQDAFMGRFDPGDERVTLPVNASDSRGEYVVLTGEGSGPARASLIGGEDGARPLRALLQEIEFGQPQQAQGDGSEVSWTFQTDRVPLQAGIFWTSSEVSQNTQATLSSPAGEILGADITSDPWIGMQGFGMITDIGDAGLIAGTYEARVAFDESAGPTPAEASHALVFYDRGQ